MPNRRSAVRKLYRGLLVGAALAALGGCYPYYYDFHYNHGGGYRDYGDHGYKGKRYHGGERYSHRDRYRQERRKRYRHYRHRY